MKLNPARRVPDTLKAKILRGSGTQALLTSMQKDEVRETLSHVACTIANLATNSTLCFAFFARDQHIDSRSLALVQWKVKS